MNLRLDAPVLALQRGEVITLDDARGVRILSRTGTVWVTEEGNPRDHILGPGECLVVGKTGRTVVQALQASSVALRPAPEAANDAG